MACVFGIVHDQIELINQMLNADFTANSFEGRVLVSGRLFFCHLNFDGVKYYGLTVVLYCARLHVYYLGQKGQNQEPAFTRPALMPV